jgi:glycosyltransferase involved in cell wall biosynthesis
MNSASSSEAPHQVPAHERRVFAPRAHAYALVIPVINEGERIRRQIERVAALAAPVDVIIADGGSTDGSLDEDFLRTHGVRALLVKTGPGRLSAQLRMAYAFCLDEGYDGVVTIDGNGKDGVEAIPRFLDKLAEGYGYVQGSRYVAGGEAVNTPLDRYIAGRFIHAPLISLAARRCYTDTTNGFRAYSRAYLLDPRVLPFRNVFSDYSLLFYLSARASQLGYRTCVVPVARRYPAAGKTPTKITGIGSRLAVLGELIRVVSGRDHPR